MNCIKKLFIKSFIFLLLTGCNLYTNKNRGKQLKETSHPHLRPPKDIRLTPLGLGGSSPDFYPNIQSDLLSFTESTNTLLNRTRNSWLKKHWPQYENNLLQLILKYCQEPEHQFIKGYSMDPFSKFIKAFCKTNDFDYDDLIKVISNYLSDENDQLLSPKGNEVFRKAPLNQWLYRPKTEEDRKDFIWKSNIVNHSINLGNWTLFSSVNHSNILFLLNLQKRVFPKDTLIVPYLLNGTCKVHLYLTHGKVFFSTQKLEKSPLNTRHFVEEYQKNISKRLPKKRVETIEPEESDKDSKDTLDRLRPEISETKRPMKKVKILWATNHLNL